MSENNKFVSWVKTHKTELIIAGVSVTAIIGIILGLKNKDAIKELWDALENSLGKTPDKISEPVTIVQTAQPVLEEVTPVRLYTSPQEPFDVSQHIRNLSGGMPLFFISAFREVRSAPQSGAWISRCKPEV